jgi:hypothetical protein
MRWLKSPDHILGWITWNYVDEVGEVLACVMQRGSDDTWHVYKHGAGYGEFIDKDAAIKRAETVVEPLRTKARSWWQRAFGRN